VKESGSRTLRWGGVPLLNESQTGVQVSDVAVPTDIELLVAAGETYRLGAVPYFEDADHAIRVFLVRRPDGLAMFAFEGTHDHLGWLIDFFSLMLKDQQGLDHRTLGRVHAGFYSACLAAAPRILLVAEKEPVAFAGHSLGAAMALMMTGLFIDYGLAPIKTGAFAPPRCGDQTFVDAVTSLPFCAYRNGNDPVTQVPFGFGDLPFRQVPLTQVGWRRLWFPACHHFPNYDAAVRASVA
jgi:Lipase (class 3)